MSRPAALRLVLFALALHLASASLACAQAAVYRVAGRVVSQADGHALPHATLNLLTVPDRRPVQSTTSDAEGAFAFENITAGKYELNGEAPGFVQTIYDQHSGFSTAIVTGSSVTAGSLVLQLIPRASLSGTITESSGEPVAQATVHLFRQAEDFGEGPVVPAGTVQTNDIGQYEFRDLPAGSYLMAVQAQPWYAAVPQSLDPFSPPMNIGIAGPADPSLNVAYPVTFYPGATTPQQASPILLRAGESSADLRLNPVPAIQITFRNVMPPPQRTPRTFNGGIPELAVDLFGTRQGIPANVVISGTDAVMTGVAPGDYILQANTSSGPTTVSRKLDLTQTTTAELPPPESLAATLVHLRFSLLLPDGSPVPGNTRLALTQLHSPPAGPFAVANARGEVTLAVAPGDYFLQIASGGRSPAPMLVRRILAGTTAVSANPLHIASQPSASSPLAYTVTAAPANIRVEGFASRDGQPAPGAFILLVPADEVHSPHNWRTQQSDLDGSFDLSAVAPGDYLLFAIESGWKLDWRADGALAPYLAGALPVRIIDSPAHIQRLQQSVTVQPRQ